MSLSDENIRLLYFERNWFRYQGTKERAIRQTLDMSPLAYYERLNDLLDDPEAEAHDPVLIFRLQRLRAFRRAQRKSFKQVPLDDILTRTTEREESRERL